MQEWFVYFQIGFAHIIDSQWTGIDHILFIAVLCTAYSPREWSRLLVLLTAFTLGHSLTLALAALRILDFNTKLVEAIIPLTIIITALYNLRKITPSTHTHPDTVRYVLASVFGLIHGLAFSNFLRDMFAHSQESIVGKLFAFNVGIELGQIVVVIVLEILLWLLSLLPLLPRISWRQSLSGIALIWGLVLFVEKF